MSADDATEDVPLTVVGMAMQTIGLDGYLTDHGVDTVRKAALKLLVVLHPDRLVNASVAVQNEGETRAAAISTARDLLIQVLERAEFDAAAARARAEDRNADARRSMIEEGLKRVFALFVGRAAIVRTIPRQGLVILQATSHEGCLVCAGFGWLDLLDTMPCRLCRGSGAETIGSAFSANDDTVHTAERGCTACFETGVELSEENRCWACLGTNNAVTMMRVRAFPHELKHGCAIRPVDGVWCAPVVAGRRPHWTQTNRVRFVWDERGAG